MNKKVDKVERVELLRAALGDIVVDHDIWCREKLSSEMVSRFEATYNANPSLVEPIKAAMCGNGLFLYDGFHRYEAMRRAKIGEQDVLVAYHLDYSSLPFESAKSNIRNGLPLTRKEIRKKVFGGYIKAGKHMRGNYRFKSYNQIAEDLGHIVSVATIWRWTERDFPAVFEAKKAEGDAPKAPPEDKHMDKEKLILSAALNHIEQIQAHFLALDTDTAKEEIQEALSKTIERLGGNPKARLVDDSQF